MGFSEEVATPIFPAAPKKNVDTILKILYPKVNAGDAGLTLGIPPKAASPFQAGSRQRQIPKVSV